jgi:hypothetical protein
VYEHSRYITNDPFGTEEPAWKWQQYILLLLDSSLEGPANAWKRRYGIPDRLCFAAKADMAGYTKLTEGCLNGSVSDSNTKIIVMSHGTDTHVLLKDKVLDPERFVSGLAKYGLRRAGLLALKGCSLGRGNFLEATSAALVRNHILVDWLIAYRDGVRQLPSGHEAVGKWDHWIRRVTHGVVRKRPDSQRVKIIKGHPYARARPDSRRYG